MSRTYPTRPGTPAYAAVVPSLRQTREPFLLDPNVVFLNHGSYGATPRPVFEEYQHLQLAMERQPVEWLQRRVPDLMAAARHALGTYVGCADDEIVYFPNPTTAINMVAKSLDLQPGDEVLTTDHEYGAMDRTWKLVCAGTGATYVQAHVPLPAISAHDVVDRVWARVTERTRVLFISQITSGSALRFPVEELVRRGRAAGVLTIVDGAHVPGHLPLDLSALGADIYTGACHKWMCAPKGSAFLYVRRDMQHLLRPLVVSWGWDAVAPSASRYVDHHEWQGTRDLSAFLATPAAIRWIEGQDWPGAQQRCRALLHDARLRVDQLTGLAPLYPDDGFEWFAQMAIVRLPELDVAELKRRLYDEFAVETPVHRVGDVPVLRISIAAYNDEQDVDNLLHALATLLPQLSD
jgi:isopenicillin-N epimerase